MRADVTILDVSVPRLRELDQAYGGRVTTVASTPYAVEAALLTTATGRGVALLAEASDVAAERTTDRMLLGHNAVIGSLGNKFRPPEVRLQIADLSTLRGSFRLLVLGTDWPEPVRRWFGEPQAASEVNQPYFNSYDK